MEEAKLQFLTTFHGLGNRDQITFLKWLEEEFIYENRRDSNTASTHESTALDNAEAIMKAAAEDIRLQVWPKILQSVYRLLFIKPPIM